MRSEKRSTPEYLTTQHRPGSKQIRAAMIKHGNSLFNCFPVHFPIFQLWIEQRDGGEATRKKRNSVLLVLEGGREIEEMGTCLLDLPRGPPQVARFSLSTQGKPPARSDRESPEDPYKPLFLYLYICLLFLSRFPHLSIASLSLSSPLACPSYLYNPIFPLFTPFPIPTLPASLFCLHYWFSFKLCLISKISVSFSSFSCFQVLVLFFLVSAYSGWNARFRSTLCSNVVSADGCVLNWWFLVWSMQFGVWLLFVLLLVCYSIDCYLLSFSRGFGIRENWMCV